MFLGGVFTAAKLLVLTTSLLQGVSGFEVLRGSLLNSLNLAVNNTELLRYAARRGQNVTASITGGRQTIIAQDGAYISLDCSSLLPSTPGVALPPVVWERRFRDEQFMALPDSSRISVSGTSGSVLHIFPISIFERGAADNSDEGDYQCSVCEPPASNQEQPICISMMVTIVFLGSRPILRQPHPTESCYISLDQLVCSAGSNISLHHSFNHTTDTLSLDHSHLVLTCDLETDVLPPATFTWTKDGVVVIRDVHKNLPNFPMIDDEFIMQGNNSLLFMIHPMPLTVTPTDLNVKVDFTANNLSMVMGGAQLLSSPAALRSFILDSLLGSWACTARNVFGEESLPTTVELEANCTNSCHGCPELAACTRNDDTQHCDCVCPAPHYRISEDGATCLDVDECSSVFLNNCSQERRLCENSDGGFRCALCEEGHIFYEGNNTCLDCKFQSLLENGSVSIVRSTENSRVVVAMAVCDEGFVPSVPTQNCTVGGGGVGVVKTEQLLCEEEEVVSTTTTTTSPEAVAVCDTTCVIILATVLPVAFLLLLLLMLLMLLIACCCWEKKHMYYV